MHLSYCCMIEQIDMKKIYLNAFTVLCPLIDIDIVSTCLCCLLPSDAVHCSQWPWSLNFTQRRRSQRSAAADCSCSALQEQPAGLTSEGQSNTHILLEIYYKGQRG